MDTRWKARLARSLLPIAALAVSGCVSTYVPPASGTGVSGADGAQAVSRSASNTLTAADIAAYPSSTTVEEVLEQHVPGFVRRSQRNVPGDDSNVSLVGMPSPLFVVDGVPLGTNVADVGVNPRDIAWIEIHRRGAGAAQYGLRGTNGVVLIYTRAQ